MGDKHWKMAMRNTALSPRQHHVDVYVTSGNILASIIMFSLIYILLFALFIYLLNTKIQRGPEIEEDVYLGSQRA